MALSRRSGFLEKIAARKQPEFRDMLNDLALRWHISHRYAPSSTLEASLRKLDNYQGLRQRTLAANSERMLDIADAVLKYGNLKWN